MEVWEWHSKDIGNECRGGRRQQGSTTNRRDNFGISWRIREAKKTQSKKVAYARRTITGAGDDLHSRSGERRSDKKSSSANSKVKPLVQLETTYD